ncbi:MAG TPA: HYExAFE family protein [Gemmataceae bacterium]|jgi:hypothetical protein|nr:HYExAFE family protein [Gemmataceae bacterium]
MDRSNHYEAAFEAFLRDRRVGFVPVDEAKRTLLGDADVKSLDFIVVDSARLVVDVKGRRFPGGTADSPRKVWQNWSTEEDVAGLSRWATHFGPDFRGVLAFVYHLESGFGVPAGTPDLFEFRDRAYLMRAVDADEYRVSMRRRSPRWGTVHLATADFRRLVRPFSHFLTPKAVFTAEGAENAEERQSL